MTNLDNILKRRDITLPKTIHLVKTMVLPVAMYGFESWTIKKAEHWRIDAFELWCWTRLLRESARICNQSILKEISPGCSLEGLMLKLKFQYFGYFMQRVDSLEKTDAGRDWGQEDNGTTEDEMAGWHHQLDRREFEWTLGVGHRQGALACCNSWGRKESDTTEWLNWTELTDAKAETPLLWPPDAKNQLMGKDPDARKDWRQEKGDDRGWYGWMASPTCWTWVWVGSGSWWCTGKPGGLQSMGSQRVGHDWAI